MIKIHPVSFVFFAFFSFYAFLSIASDDNSGVEIGFERDFIFPFADSLPTTSTNGVNIAPEITTPIQTLLNLAPLYQQGLSGHKQIAAVIEFNGFRTTPPGLEGVFINTFESDSKVEEHSSLVSQVFSSRIKHLSVAPNATLFLGIVNSITDEIKITGFEDAIKLAIRRGAKAINLSVVSSNNIFSKKEVEHDYWAGLYYAVNSGIPIFIAAGNNNEILEDDFLFKELIRINMINKENLFVFVVGFNYPKETYDRDDIHFENYSARITSSDRKLKRNVIAAPFRMNAYSLNDDKRLEKAHLLK